MGAGPQPNNVIAIGGIGAIGSTTVALPLFNVVRVDFRTSSGRPSRKYLRILLVPADVAGSGGILPSTVGYVTTDYSEPMALDTRFVDVDGEAFTGFTTYNMIAMRQLRRGSKRRLQPII